MINIKRRAERERNPMRCDIDVTNYPAPQLHYVCQEQGLSNTNFSFLLCVMFYSTSSYQGHPTEPKQYR